MNNNISNKKPIFVFDLHGVIFKLSPVKVIKELLKCSNKLKLISILFYPKVFIKTYVSLRNGAIAEETLYTLAKEFPQFQILLPTGFNVINAQEPIFQTVDIIKKLKSKNYKLYILSNIGQDSMKIMQNKFPEVFANFDGVMSASPADNYLKKPNLKAFEKYLNMFNQKSSEIVFIDDRLKNIKAAEDLQIPTILYKSPKDLYKQLKSLQIEI